MAADPLLRFRDRFPILQRTKYLVSHSLGAMPEATREALDIAFAVVDDILRTERWKRQQTRQTIVT